jgi:DNA polymerase-3 subunit gamma/tau
MLNVIGEMEIRFKRSGQQQLLVETLLVRFALLDRTVSLEDVLEALGGGGGGTGGGGGGGGRSSSGGGESSRTFAEGARSGGPNRMSGTSTKTTTAAGPVATSLVHDAVVDSGASRGSAPFADIAALTGKWDELVSRLRASGKALLGAALESSSPATITARGDLTIKLDEPNDFHAKAIEQSAAEILEILGEWFQGIDRIALHRHDAPKQPGDKPKRVTDEMVKSERLNTLRRKDPVLDSAIEVLDLEIAE